MPDMVGILGGDDLAFGPAFLGDRDCGDIRFGKHGRKVIHEVARPGIPVRLEDEHDTPVGPAIARRGQQVVELAHRVAYLDHMAEGRYQVGVGIGVLPTDHALFALDASTGEELWRFDPGVGAWDIE